MNFAGLYGHQGYKIRKEGKVNADGRTSFQGYIQYIHYTYIHYNQEVKGIRQGPIN